MSEMASEALVETVGLLLKKRGLTVAVAESCTGGQLGAAITSVAGSSDYFLGGVIAYANSVKSRQLGVDPGLIEREGAVSALVARQMAAGARRLFASDLAVGITGVAGPAGGSPEKPVGLVFIAVDAGDRVDAERFRFSGDRDAVRKSSVIAALEMVKSHLK